MESTHIVRKIANVGLMNLTRCLGASRLDRLNQVGIQMTSSNIASVIFQEQGFEVFRNVELRMAILNSLSQEELSCIYGSESSPQNLERLAKFRWTRESRKVERFLSIFGLKLEDVFGSTKKDLEHFVQTVIDKPLFDYQNNIRKRLNSFIWSKDKKRVVAHMPTGAGKTRTTMEVIVDFIRSRSESEPILVVWLYGWHAVKNYVNRLFKLF